MAVYVDNILLLGKDLGPLATVKAALNNSFKMKDLGEVSTMLSLQVTQDRRSKSIALD